ncbi:DUF4910 domain-containing protein, partial [bacterium]|nr:DUF4910 domain-containing protein [bacterium]
MRFDDPPERTPMLDRIWQAMAGELSGERARDSVARLWEHARWNSFDRMRDTAAEAAALLRETGLQDVQVLEFPADGVTAHGGWVMPQAWDVDDATLEIVEPAVDQPLLARYRDCPQNLMMWSAPTPPDGVEAEVVLAGESCEGKIVLADGVGLDVGRDAFARGAIGVVSDHIKLAGTPQDKGDGHFDHAVQWHNYTLPLWRTERQGFGFSISPTQGRRLRALLAERTAVRLRAVVRTRLYDGVLPCVTGLLPGGTDEEIVLTGHLFEPGANDNASGPAQAVECIRAIRTLCERGDLPPLRRGLRPVFTFEVRGYQAFLATWERLNRIVAGINLDMVGNDLTDARAQANLVYNFPSMPAYTDVLAEELLERLVREDESFRFRVHRAGALVDNLFGEPAVGAPMAVLGCWPDAYYHNSLDTLDTISPQAMAGFGRMAGTYMAFLATAGLDEARWLADLVVRRSEDVPPEKTAARLQSIVRLVPPRSIVPTREGLDGAGDWLSAETHLFQDEELKEYIEERVETSLPIPSPLGGGRLSAVGQAGGRGTCGYQESTEGSEAVSTPPSQPPPEGGRGSLAADVDHARTLAPARTFKGALCLESLDEDALAEFEAETGVGLSWGVPHWLQLAVFRANGKRSAWDIYRWLCGEAPAPPLGRFCNAVELLARHGFLRLRP